MKKPLALLMGLLAFSLFAQAPKTAVANDVKTVRVLAIGNSWCWSLVRYFKQVVDSTGDYKLELEFVVSGGWSFQRHWKEYEKYLADPSLKTYQYGLTSKADETRYSFVDKLEMQKWDYVVLTQAPQHAAHYENGQPYFSKLVDVIRKHAPTAEILIQQTWSLNINDASMGEPSVRFAEQTAMYEKTVEVIDRLAEEEHVRVIPTGYIVEKFRNGKAMPIWDVKAMEEFRPKSAVPEYPDLVGYFMWYNLGTPAEHWLADTVHLNNRGEYMQACLWGATLFGLNLDAVTFVPNGIEPAMAKNLRTLVKNGLAEYLQEKSK